MAQRNLLSLTSVYTDTVVQVATDSMVDIIPDVAVDTGQNIDAIFCCNVSDGTVGWITVLIKRSGTSYRQAYKKRVAIKDSINVLLGKPLYLKEGDSIRIQANANANIEVSIPRSVIA